MGEITFFQDAGFDGRPKIYVRVRNEVCESKFPNLPTAF